jgi:hypothetical protein
MVRVSASFLVAGKLGHCLRAGPKFIQDWVPQRELFMAIIQHDRQLNSSIARPLASLRAVSIMAESLSSFDPTEHVYEPSSIFAPFE